MHWFSVTFLVVVLYAPVQAETFQYIYDETGQLIKAIDSTGTVIEYVYDEVGNILEIKRSTVTGLVVFGFAPREGTIGTDVSIQGKNFDTNLTSNTVEFNGTSATILSATANLLEVTVPPGATSGPLSITVGGNTAFSGDDFIVIGVPGVNSINPPGGIPGQVISNFTVQGTSLQGADFAF